MTLASMTGFARAAAEIAQGSLVWELKTVNGKGLDLRLRLPARFDAEEARFRVRLGTLVRRGTCQATLSLQRAARVSPIRIDQAMLRALIEAAREAMPADGSVSPPSFDGLLAVPGVVVVGEGVDAAEDHAAVVRVAGDLLEVALGDLGAGRAAEGEALRAVLERQLQQIGGLTEAADRAPGRTPAAVRARLERAVGLLAGQNPALDANRLHQEALLLATRADVQEELDRLRVHRASAQGLLADGGVVGRKLDFLAQELAREANTLCAKSNDADLTAIGMDLRNTIEQFREQVQNLE